jgi:hypothetical protein
LNKQDYVRLITFACPHVGDDEFVKYFESAHTGRYRHVVNLSDPITYSPPPVLSKLLPILGRSIFTAWGLVLVVMSFCWPVYAMLWRAQKPYSAWADQRGLLFLGGKYNWICLLEHTRQAYRRRISAL